MRPIGKLFAEESKVPVPNIPSPSTDTVSAGTVMLKSTDDRYLPYAASIESGNLVISNKQVRLGLDPIFHSLDSFSIQSVDTEDQRARKSHLFSAKLRF